MNYLEKSAICGGRFINKAVCFLAIFSCLVISKSHAQFIFATDNADNYGGNWTPGSDGGSGFGGWGFTSGASSGSFLGNPANNGISNTGMGTTAFGMFANGAGYADRSRGFDVGMGIGDVFTFDWGMNWDANGGAKGFDLKAGGTKLFTINNGGSSTITVNGAAADANYGTGNMAVTLTRTASGYTFSMTSRSGGSAYTTALVTSSTIDNINYYIGNQNSSDGQRNIYFDNLSISNSGVFNQGGTVNNANRFTGTGNLSVGNNTTLALTGSGNNNYTGTTTIGSGSSLRFEGAGTSDFASAISGAGSVVISSGAGVLNLTGNNSGLTGAITVSSGILEARNANSLGSTAAGTTVASGGTLKIFSSGAGFSLADSINIAGVGVGSGIGAINNTGGDNTLTGTVTLAANTRINADTTGSSGSLTIGGNISGGANVLYLGAQGTSGANTGGNIIVSGAISGAGATDTSITSVFKDGAGTLTLSGANNYTGDTRIAAGNLTVSGSGTLGTGSDIFIGSGGSLSVNVNTSVASLQEWGTGNAGTVSIGTGATLTVNGADKSTMFQNSISGAGGLTMAGSGTSTLSLYGTQGYTGTTTVSGGKISSGVALASSGITVSGGTFETSAADIVANTSAVNMSSGTYALGGNDTVASLAISGGVLSSASGSTLTAETYALNGGEVSANLGAGTVNASSGTTLLSGTSAAANVNVQGGTLNTGSANRLDNGAAVVVSSGTLGMGGNDTIGSLSTTGGTVSGSGTLTAATYALNGGTVSVKLGEGTVNASSGTTSLSGTSAAANVNVSGGLLTLASASRLADTAAVAVSSGTLAMTGSDTIGSLSTTGGTVSGTGTLTAATYALNGGTVSVNLGEGTVNASSGTTSLSGTSAAANVNVSGGLLTLASVNRLADTAAVAVSSGELAMSGDDTIGSLSTTGGTVSGTGTLTAATYALNGGTVSVKLGSGTATASSGTTSLSGTSASTVVNVSGGLLSLVSANRLADAAAVAVSSGELSMGGNDTIGSLTTTGGTVSGAGTLTAATYALNGGTVSANLGLGTATVSSGTTTLSGTSAATVVNVVGGVLNTSGANKLADGAAVAVSSGTLGVGGSDAVGSLSASGTGVVTVASGTTLTANGNSSITGSARATGGTVAVANNSLLNLANSSTTTTSDLSIGSGSTLAGTGGTSGQIKGSGLLSPGNSPGILTSGSVDLTGGIDFAFEFTAAGAPTYSLAGNSRNDLLHLTSGSAPFSGSFSTGNTVSFYFNDSGLSASLASVTPTTYLGGFFVDSSSFDIAGLLSNATKQYFIAAAGGSTSFNGVSYNLMSNEVADRIILSNVNQSGADFATGTVNGTVLGVMAVPEPSSGSLLLAGIGSLLVLRRFRKKA